MYPTHSTETRSPRLNGHVRTDPGHAERSDSAPAGSKRAGRRVLALSLFALVALGAGLVVGTRPRLQREHDLNTAAEAAASAAPRVNVATARKMGRDAERVLPGSCLPLLETAVHARTNGYLTRRLVDIGDEVKEGQLLAEIATPEVDAQLDQARATLQQTRANLVRDRANAAFAQSEEHRYRYLSQTRAGTREEYESKTAAAQVAAATVKASEATVKVNEADVQRLATLQSFEKLAAPFGGVITARNVDPGALISAGTPGTTRELFHLMKLDTVRVWVNVPQTFAAEVKVGQGAVVFRREDPSRPFRGKVTRTANSLDPNTRTLLTEVQVPNPDRALLPGMYLQVKFVFNRGTAPVRVPSAALVVGATGTRVAVLDGRNAVHYRKVELGRDYGAEVEVTAGLAGGETVVVHPGDEVPEGTVVEPVAQPAK